MKIREKGQRKLKGLWRIPTKLSYRFEANLNSGFDNHYCLELSVWHNKNAMITEGIDGCK